MATREEWIKVLLTPDEVSRAEEIGRQRTAYARRRGFKPKGLGNNDTDILGSLGEAAVARYEGVELDPDWTWEADKRRGYDVAGWCVRTRSNLRQGLPVKPGEAGKYLLVYGHQQPLMWLAGWIDGTSGYRLGSPQSYNGHSWREVGPGRLHALPEQNNCKSRGRGVGVVLVDPEAWFFCENCNSRHPIRLHASCRQGLLLERSQRIRGEMPADPSGYLGDRTS